MEALGAVAVVLVGAFAMVGIAYILIKLFGE